MNVHLIRISLHVLLLLVHLGSESLLQRFGLICELNFNLLQRCHGRAKRLGPTKRMKDVTLAQNSPTTPRRPSTLRNIRCCKLELKTLEPKWLRSQGCQTGQEPALNNRRPKPSERGQRVQRVHQLNPISPKREKEREDAKCVGKTRAVKL